MQASPRQHLYKPSSEEVLGLRNLIIVSNQTEGETGEKAKSTRGSNRAVLALIIIVSLISLTALLLTLLMLSGRIGPANEGQCTN